MENIQNSNEITFIEAFKNKNQKNKCHIARMLP